MLTGVDVATADTSAKKFKKRNLTSSWGTVALCVTLAACNPGSNHGASEDASAAVASAAAPSINYGRLA